VQNNKKNILILYPNTLFVGKVCVHLDTVPSTQTYLKNLYAKSKPIEGTAILSYNQTAGYGQRNNLWEAQAGMNIALSLILLPVFLDPDKQFYLSMAVALAVKKTVEEFSQQKVKLKWPNDIMVGDRKISGILIESNMHKSRVEKSFVGIGLNVNQVDFGPLKYSATSISNISGKEYEPDSVSISLMQWVERYYLQLKAGRRSQISDEYHEVLYKKDEYITLQHADGRTSRVIIKGVNEQGKLLVEDKEGLAKAYLHGEVQIKYAEDNAL